MFFKNIFWRQRRINSGLILLLLSGLLSYLAIGCSLPRPQTSLTEGGVRFALRVPHARRVAVVGDFNNWDTDEDILDGPDAHGVWKKTIHLPEGRYEYLFLVDGKTWLPDPAALSLEDGLGRANSVIYVNE